MSLVRSCHRCTDTLKQRLKGWKIVLSQCQWMTYAYIPHDTCGGQRTLGDQFLLPPCRSWIGLGDVRFDGKCLYLLSHLTGPSDQKLLLTEGTQRGRPGDCSQALENNGALTKLHPQRFFPNDKPSSPPLELNKTLLGVPRLHRSSGGGLPNQPTSSLATVWESKSSPFAVW